MNELLGEFGVKFYETVPDKIFSCNCSKEQVEKAVMSVGKDEINDMIKDGQRYRNVNCHFCNTHITHLVWMS